MSKLSAALTAMKKKYGSTSVFQGSENVVEDVETYSTGSLALDAALLSGGYPRGRIVQIRPGRLFDGYRNGGKKSGSGVCLEIFA